MGLLLHPEGTSSATLPFVKSHFTVVLIAIILISLLPAVYEFWKHWKEKREGETAL